MTCVLSIAITQLRMMDRSRTILGASTIALKALLPSEIVMFLLRLLLGNDNYEYLNAKFGTSRGVTALTAERALPGLVERDRISRIRLGALKLTAAAVIVGATYGALEIEKRRLGDAFKESNEALVLFSMFFVGSLVAIVLTMKGLRSLLFR